MLRSASSLFAALLLATTAVFAQTAATPATPATAAPAKAMLVGPVSDKAKKSFASARDWEKSRHLLFAVDDYRKAFKQDDGHCTECLALAYNDALQSADLKLAVELARLWLAAVTTPPEQNTARIALADALVSQSHATKNNGPLITEAESLLRNVLAVNPSMPLAYYQLGTVLALENKDDEARDAFRGYLQRSLPTMLRYRRAQRFVERIDLVRARMAPPFAFWTIDGKQVNMDDLAGKVVLIDFWATWCGPCRAALPNIQQIAKKFSGQPLVIVSISLDADEKPWREFVAKNHMDWMQAFDGRWTGPVATAFNVKAIPATFTIDADGVIEDQHVGDANLERTLKKLLAALPATVSNEHPVQNQ